MGPPLDSSDRALSFMENGGLVPKPASLRQNELQTE